MTCLLDIRDFDEVFFEKLKEAEKKISDSHKDKKKNKLSLYARVVLGYMLKRDYGLDFFGLCYGEKGKPYLKNDGIFFNISHSDSLVLCSVCESEIGCDVQKIQEYRPRVAERFFCEKEISLLRKSDDQSRTFIKLWALKESILKKQGDGIGGGLDSFDFSDYITDDSFSAYGCYFSRFSFEDYEIAVCSESEKQSLEIITKEEFERYVDRVNGKNT